MSTVIVSEDKDPLLAEKQIPLILTERHLDRHTRHRQTDRQTDRKTDSYTRQTVTQGRQIHFFFYLYALPS